MSIPVDDRIPPNAAGLFTSSDNPSVLLAKEFDGDEDLWIPWPEYEAIFNERPEEAAAVAKSLFSTRDKRFLPFMLSFPWDQSPREIDARLHSSNFRLVLLDIATNERWYLQLTYFSRQGHDVTESLLAHQLSLTLRCLVWLIYVRDGRVFQPGPQMCRIYRSRLPALLKVFWKHRDVVMKREFTQSRDAFLGIIGYILSSYYVILDCFSEWFDYLSGHRNIQVSCLFVTAVQYPLCHHALPMLPSIFGTMLRKPLRIQWGQYLPRSQTNTRRNVVRFRSWSNALWGLSRALSTKIGDCL
ncbi:hypothetical protein BC629DRAFT_1564070 [Irpex lacteus]|nr:hypothetical protein BC629DRAFT_1564070 [Irpex lacteus]